MMRSGARLLIDGIKAEGTKIVFGFPGGVVIPVFDALYGERGLRLVLARHEQGAVHAADGYARSSGDVGVCIVTSGPGATNTVTGLATANFDSVPLVVFTGQVSRSLIGNDAFQEADIVGISRSVTKHNYLVMDRRDLGRVIHEAYHIARTGRPGPVLVDLPKDVLTEISEDGLVDAVSIRGYNPVYRGDPDAIGKAARALAEAKRPVFYLGGGVNISGAAELFARVQEVVDVPTTASLMGISATPSAHPRFLGMIGMHGTFAANTAVQSCDLLFCIGARFDDRATGDLSKFAPHAAVVHIDIDPSTIGRNVKADIPIVGDARTVLEDILPLLRRPHHDEWIRQTDEWKETPAPRRRDRQREALPHARAEGDIGSVPRRDRLHGGRTAPDVDGAVLRLPKAEDIPHLRGPGHHGVRVPCRHRGAARQPRAPRHRHCRRRIDYR